MMVAHGKHWPAWLLAVTCAVACLLAALHPIASARAQVPTTAPARSSTRTPLALRPPGTFAAETGPSAVIFPPQRLTIRFDHKRHVRGLELPCTECHVRARTSQNSRDSLLPAGTRCDRCHHTDHTDLDQVSRDEAQPLSACERCHVGYAPEHGNRVARQHVPAPNLKFNHAAHAARNIGCAQCHGAVAELGLATRDQLPRMRGCFRCHQQGDSPGLARGDAKGECSTCHIVSRGTLKTQFAAGQLVPPRWLHDAAHGPDWLERHKTAAGADSRFCGNCHKEESCTACHDGRVRPRQVHPNDWLNLHGISARQHSQQCTSCHSQQSFCVSCHQRAGVTQTAPYANQQRRGRFHPPRAVWTDRAGSAGHHAWEAQRNLNACVSCHLERDCASCHATAEVGGASGGRFGRSPHPPGFRDRCQAALSKNARPCLVCHAPGDPAFSLCR